MTTITAQVSLYPLRQKSLSPAIDTSLRIFRTHKLDVDPGIMSTLIIGDDEAIFAALRDIIHDLAGQGDVVMSATFSNACPVPARREETFTYRAIGHVKNKFNEPISPDEIRATDSQIVLNPSLIEGLRGLETGHKLLVLFDFHQAQDYDLLQHPRGDNSRSKRGVFALRSPHRPNSIGYCEVELVAFEENILHVRGLDAINGTPVLDLKPA